MILEFSIKAQLICCLVSAVTGVFFGLLYDALRVIFMLTGIDPHEKKLIVFQRIAVAILDLIFMAVISIIFAVVMYAYAYGKFRVVFGICCLAGFIVYNKTLSRVVIFLLHKIITAVKAAIRFVLSLLLYPVKLICKYTVKLVTFAYNVALSPILSQVKYRFDILQFNKISRSIDVVVKFEDVSDNGC